MHNKGNKSAWQGNEPELEGRHIWTREASEKTMFFVFRNST